MNIQILNYQNNKIDTGIDFNDVSQIEVHVISGDEVVALHMKNDNRILRFDADDTRIMDYNDGTYYVSEEFFEFWKDRKDSYEWFDRPECTRSQYIADFTSLMCKAWQRRPNLKFKDFICELGELGDDASCVQTLTRLV